MPSDVSQSDPAEGSREVIDRELERHKNDCDMPAKLNKRRKVRAARNPGVATSHEILRSSDPRTDAKRIKPS